MKNISFDHLFESNAAKIANKNNSSNSIKMEKLKKAVALIIKEELSEKQRKILDMYFTEGLSYTQIAHALNVNKSTISRTKSRALKKISNILKYYDFR